MRRSLPLAACVAALLLASCGGDDAPVSCDIASQKASLRQYLFEAYLWTGSSPNPDPAPYADLPAYLDALRYAGDGARVPADRFSNITDSASFDRFYGSGQSLGYGVAVNALEAQLPLRVRHVEALSPAAAAGLQRGDRVVSIAGRSDADLVASNDYSALNASAAGDTVTIVVDRGAGPVSVTLTAAVYNLTPVAASGVITLANGQRAGYLMLKDFIGQAESALVTAFANFRAAGATELIIDLRYNGGGRISVAQSLASLVAGNAVAKPLATLRHNAKRVGLDGTYYYGGASGTPFTRAVIVTGARTCSASELLINGLSPHMTVVTVGDTTCGKPVGFEPTAGCGSTVSAVNFEVVNALGNGRYYDGLGPTCAATDTFTGTPGDRSEAMTGAALAYLESGTCTAPPPAPPGPSKRRIAPFGERSEGMLR